MGTYVIKTAMGGFKPASEEMATHIVLTKDDYHDTVNFTGMMRDDVKRLSRQNRDLHIQCQDASSSISGLKSRLQEAEKAAQDMSAQNAVLESGIADLKEDNSRLNAALAQAESLNANLRRICRERANQARGISPKGTHDGYIVLISREWREKAQDGQTIRGYKTTIQSPYDASMDDKTAKAQIFDDLTSFVLTDLGCGYYTPVNGRPKTTTEDLTMYRWIYAADYRAGLWTVTIYTNGPLSVPEHRRPPQKRKIQGGKQNEKG